MIVALVLGLVALLSVGGTLVSLRHDPPRDIPRSRRIDPDFLPPAQRWRVES